MRSAEELAAKWNYRRQEVPIGEGGRVFPCRSCRCFVAKQASADSVESPQYRLDQKTWQGKDAKINTLSLLSRGHGWAVIKNKKRTGQ